LLENTFDRKCISAIITTFTLTLTLALSLTLTPTSTLTIKQVQRFRTDEMTSFFRESVQMPRSKLVGTLGDSQNKQNNQNA